MAELALGTVQFGVAYGIANASGKTPPEEVVRILTCARSAGISMLDTASGYGDSEIVLGAAGVAGWQVVTKLAEVPSNCTDVEEWIEGQVQQSLTRLGLKCLHGLLLHRPQQLQSEVGGKIWQALLKQKDLGQVRSIGYSIYDPEELDALYRKYPAEIVQGPFNVLDRRLAQSGWLARLADGGTSVHVRSAFLQGLLLMAPDERPSWTRAHSDALNDFDDWVADSGLERHAACLGYCLSRTDISHVVVGVQDVKQLTAAIAACKYPAMAPTAWTGSDALDLIDPRRWPTR